MASGSYVIDAMIIMPVPCQLYQHWLWQCQQLDERAADVILKEN